MNEASNKEILFQEDGIALIIDNDELFFTMQNDTYHLSSYPYEPCLYMKLDDRIVVTIHN